MFVEVWLEAKERTFSLIVVDDTRDILVLFTINTLEDSKTFVNCDGLDAT